MATTIGRSKTVHISTDGVTYTAIGKIIDADVSWSNELADETTDDSAGFKESKYADTQMTLNFSGKLNTADAGQTLLITAATTKVTYYYRYRPSATTGELQYIFQGNVESLDWSGSTGEVQDFSCTVQSTGTVTKSSQT